MLKFSAEKTKPSRTRKLPFLPRIGFVIDVAGRRFSIRQVPLLESLTNLIQWGLSRSNLERIEAEQLAEVVFPVAQKSETVEVKARLISEEPKDTEKSAKKHSRKI